MFTQRLYDLVLKISKFRISSRAEEIWECEHWSSDQKVFGYRSNMVRILGRMKRGSNMLRILGRMRRGGINPIWLEYWVG